jgi:AhpD family alkylhydroperoxidase
MNETLYPRQSKALSDMRRDLAPEMAAAFNQFSQAVFQGTALSVKTKHLIAVAVAHVTQCPYCIRGHTKAASREGATSEEIMEAIWVAAEMRAGAAFAHSSLALDVLRDGGFGGKATE